MNIEQAILDAMRIADQMRLRREQLRTAIDSGDKDEVVRSARCLLGMVEDSIAEGDRPTPGVERGPSEP